MRRIVLKYTSVLICLTLLGCDAQTESPERPLATNAGFDGLGTVFNPTSLTGLTFSKRCRGVTPGGRLPWIPSSECPDTRLLDAGLN